MLSFKAKLTLTDRIIGKRVKRRIGKPEQCRSYYCKYCNGYHLTSREDNQSKHSRKKKFLETRSQELEFIKTKYQADQWKEDSLPFPDLPKPNQL